MRSSMLAWAGHQPEVDLGSFLAGALGNKTAALIVVSLGTNDASASRSEELFKASYSALLTHISRLAPHVVVMAIPPADGHLKSLNATIDEYNLVLPDLARQAGATFVGLPAMPEPHTLDAVHLNDAGYQTAQS